MYSEKRIPTSVPKTEKSIAGRAITNFPEGGAIVKT